MILVSKPVKQKCTKREVKFLFLLKIITFTQHVFNFFNKMMII